MYQSNLSSDNCFKRFTGESFGAAILNSGASNTVCGGMRIDCYTESLSGKETESLKHLTVKTVLNLVMGENSSPSRSLSFPQKLVLKTK